MKNKARKVKEMRLRQKIDATVRVKDIIYIVLTILSAIFLAYLLDVILF